MTGLQRTATVVFLAVLLPAYLLTSLSDRPPDLMTAWRPARSIRLGLEGGTDRRTRTKSAPPRMAERPEGFDVRFPP